MITIAYSTCRKDPKFQWFVDALYRQMQENRLTEHDIIFVDSYADSSERIEELKNIVKDRFSYRHVPPKPTVWQGKYRKTNKNLFAAANHRNTAFVYALGSHIVFCDDCSVPRPGWLSHHLEAASRKEICAGIQTKVWDIEVVDGNVVNYDHDHVSVDSRVKGTIEYCKNNGDPYKNERQKALGKGWLFSNNFSIPMEFALKVNGFDEHYDGQYGCEDCDFSVRLCNAGYTIFLNPQCEIFESEEAHGGEKFVENIEAKCIEGRHANDWYVNSQVGSRYLTVGNRFKLEDLRKMLHGDGLPHSFEIENDWRDGQSLGAL